MINKIIYIGYQPLTTKVIDDFYFIEANKRNYEIEYWDLTNIYFPNIEFSCIIEQFSVAISDYKALEKKIKENVHSETFFIPIVTFEFRVLNLFLLLTKYNCKTGFFGRGALPLTTSVISTKHIKQKLLKLFDIKLLVSFMKNKYCEVLKVLKIVKPYELIFNAGEDGVKTIGYGCQVDIKNARIANINSFDFDKYKLTLEKANKFDVRYCLFLDEYLPFHPDFELLSIKTIEPKEYYDSLNKFFDIIEKKYSLKVIIAAHPKAEKYKGSDYFCGRKVCFNETALLAKFAEFTIAHGSTSISFSVLNSNPILFLYTTSLQTVMPLYYTFILNLSKLLGSIVLNIDDFLFEDIIVNPIVESKYLNYKYKYLTSTESESIISSEIFFKEISKF